MKKSILSFCLWLLAMDSSIAQSIVQIGTGNLVPSSTLYSPVYRFSAASTTRHAVSTIIFEAAELAAAGITPGTRIDSLAFQKANTAASTIPFLYEMHIGTSSRTAPLPLNLVWNDILIGKQTVINSPAFNLLADTGWYVFNFSAPFFYTGGSLEIATRIDYGTSPANVIDNQVQWRYTDNFSGNIVGEFNSSATFNANTVLNGNVAAYKHRPNIRFYTGPGIANDAAVSSFVGIQAPMSEGSSQQVSVQILNAGTSLLNSVNLNYQIDQEPIVSQTFTTSLANGNSANFTFSTPFIIPSSSNFQLRVWVSGINGGGVDANQLNDTLSNSFCVAVPSGIATVSTGGTFETLQQALNQLQCGGIAGPVTIQILENQTGIFTINNIPGTANFNVIFSSPNGSIIGNAGQGTVFTMNGGANIVFQNLVFERTAVPTAANFVFLAQNTSNITVINNIFRGLSGSTSTANNLVRINNSQAFVFSQNTVRDGHIGFNSNASTAGQPSAGQVVNNNLFENLNGSAILFDGAGGSDQTTIENNTIRNTNIPTTTADAITVTNATNSLIKGNRITGNIGRYGIHLNNYNGTATNPNLVINNLVSGLFASTTPNALRLTSVGSALADRDFARVVHNSFHIRTASTSTTANGAIFITGGTATAPTTNGIIFRNNLVSIGHTGTRPAALRMLHFSNAVYLDSNLITFSHNHYNNGTGNFANIVTPAQVIATFAAWQALASSPDQNSANSDPQVLALGTDDLRPTASSPLVNAGLSQADVTSDITGAPRDAQPDIGAFEFAIVLNSAAMVNVISPQVGRLLPGSQPVAVRFTNTGTNNITALQVGYQLGTNNAVTENWSGTLAPGDTLLYNFTTPLTVPTGIQTNLNFRVWTALPNGQTDPDPANDTISTLNCVAIPSGTYTVGSPTSTFPNVQNWVNYLNCAGITGPVTFQMDFPNNVHTSSTLRFINIPGLSATNTLELNGMGDTIRFEAVTGDRALIYLENCDHVTIRNFNLVSTAVNFGFGIHLNGADSVRIIGNRIDLSAVTTTTATQTNGIIASASATAFTATTAQALFVDSNIIIGGNSGVRVVGSATDKSRTLYIGRNIIRDFHQNGVFLVQVDSALVENNEISRAQRIAVGVFQGINLEAGAEGVMVRANRIHSSHNSATVRTAAAFGLRISSVGTITKRNYLVNNLIYGFSTTGNQNGILLNVSNLTDVLFNTIYLDDTLASGAARAIYLQGLNQNLRIFNNNLVVNKGGTGEKQVLFLERDTTSIQINHNNYYTASTTGVANILHFGTTGFANIATWRAQYPQYDSLSVNANPLFENINLANFTPTSAVLDAAGLAINYVNSDLNGVTRSVTPDIGAIEFTPAANDLALVQILTNLNDGCVSSLQIPIQVRVTNVGNANIDTVYLTYRINSQPFQRDTIATGLASGVILNYTFQQPGQFTNGTDTLLVFVNGTGDSNPANDTLRRIVTNFQASVQQTPYSEDFETTLPMALCINRGDSSQVLIQGASIANLPVNGTGSLVMMGSATGTPWTAPTVTNWWTINPNHLSEATIYVNVSGLRRLNLAFNLRQLFNTTAANNNFRVLVNGQAVTPVGGTSPTIRPVNASSSSTTIPLRYNLDAFLVSGADTIEITFQSSVRFNTSNATPNGNAIDSLRITIPQEIRFQNLTTISGTCAPATQNISVTLDTLAAVSQVNLQVGAYGHPFTSIGMTRGAAGTWQTTLPAQPVNRIVRYAVVAQDANGNWSSDTLSFENRPGSINLGPDQTINLGQQATINASVQLNGRSTLRFTEFMHFKSPTANIQTTWPIGVPNNADDMIELRNFGTDTVDLAGLRMVLFGSTSRWTLDFPAGARVAPGRVAVVLPGTGAQDFVNQVFYMGGTTNNVLTSTNRNGAVLIDTSSNALIDIFMTNDSILPPDLNLPASAWTGRINSNSLTGIRRINANLNGAAAWGLYSATDTTGFGYINPSLNLSPNPASVLWFEGTTAAGNGLSRTFSPSSTTTYRVEYSLGNCLLRDTVVVTVLTTPAPDLTISRIITPVSGPNRIVAPVQPQVWVRNVGTAPANGFSVTFEVNGNSQGAQNFTQSIGVNDSLLVSLNAWNPTTGNYDLCFEVNTPNDLNTANNRSCINGVQITNATSVKDINMLGLRLYPNPATDVLQVELPETDDVYDILTMDATGRILSAATYRSASGNLLTLEVQNLANGSYYLKVQNKAGQFSHLRFMVVR